MADEINLYDFSKMHIDLSRVGADQLVIDVFPELKENKAYTEASDLEVRLSFLMCDPRGPFSTIKRYEARLQRVCKWLKVDYLEKEKSFYGDILHLKNDKVAAIWTAYLSNVFNHEWTSWFSNSLLYYQMMEEMRRPLNFKDSNEWKLRKEVEGRADDVYNRMKAMEQIIFVDEFLKQKSFNLNKDLIENFPEGYADPAETIV